MRKISKRGRAAMREAGRRSMEALHARTQADAQAEVETFRSGLLRELGDAPTTIQRALVESATTTLAAILRTRKELLKRRQRNAMALTERAGWLNGNLLRTIKALELPKKPRPRCLADLTLSKVAANPEIERPNPPISAGK